VLSSVCTEIKINSETDELIIKERHKERETTVFDNSGYWNTVNKLATRNRIIDSLSIGEKETRRLGETTRAPVNTPI
jgi:hypothetical protein